MTQIAKMEITIKKAQMPMEFKIFTTEGGTGRMSNSASFSGKANPRFTNPASTAMA